MTPLFTRPSAFITAAGIIVGALGLTTGATALAPHHVKAWADALGISPTTVVMAVMLWMLAWRGHGQLLTELRDLKNAIHALTLAVMADDDENPPPPRIIRARR